MVKRQLNYDNTYFHKIVCRDENIPELYVGHNRFYSARAQS